MLDKRKNEWYSKEKFNMLNEEGGIKEMQFRVKQCREEIGLSQEALSEKSGVSRTIISGLESGKITVTTTETLLKISSALGKNVSEIFLS